MPVYYCHFEAFDDTSAIILMDGFEKALCRKTSIDVGIVNAHNLCVAPIGPKPVFYNVPSVKASFHYRMELLFGR